MPSDELLPYLRFPDRSAQGHAVEPLFGGEAVFGAMLAAIASARREVLVELFTFKDGEVARRFTEVLVERAAAGVRVRMVLDALGSNELSDGLRDELRARGVGLVFFHPLAPWLSGWGWRVRDHRKMVVVDGQVAFVGGTNVGDEYAPPEWGGGGWHDVHLRLRGPKVELLRELFAISWAEAQGEGPALAELPPPGVAGETLVEVLALGSRRDRMTIRRQVHHAVAAARRTVRIQAAYFVPDLGWKRLLVAAARRGVDVRVMIPGESDQRVVQLAAWAALPRLLRGGVRVFEWGGPMLHAKTFSVDGRWCAVGSYNLDRWSLRHNWELVLGVADGGTAAELERRFEEDLSLCRELSLAEVRRVPWIRRRLASLSYTLREWL